MNFAGAPLCNRTSLKAVCLYDKVKNQYLQGTAYLVVCLTP